MISEHGAEYVAAALSMAREQQAAYDSYDGAGIIYSLAKNLGLTLIHPHSTSLHVRDAIAFDPKTMATTAPNVKPGDQVWSLAGGLKRNRKVILKAKVCPFRSQVNR